MYSDPRYRRAAKRLKGQPCMYCGIVSDTTDHIVPLSRGGSNDEDNLGPSCAPCNRAKSDRLVTVPHVDRGVTPSSAGTAETPASVRVALSPDREV